MNNFIPKETYTKISDISINYLINDKKIKGLIFDFDGTLKINKKISIETLNFIKKVQNSGLKLSILSNNPYVNKTLLKTLNINTTKKFACKPLKKPFILMAQKMNLNVSVGNILCSSVFYVDAEKKLKPWVEMGVFAVEMESFALYLNAVRAKKNALCILTVTDEIFKGKLLNSNERQEGILDMAKLALNVAESL